VEWVNYHHLLYFWLVAREGSRASAELRLAQSTVSKQIHLFEHVLGHELFTKNGRRLVLTASERPASLDNAPVLLPTENTVMRKSLEQWFDAQSLRPNVEGEFEDSALLKVFGLRGAGLFPAAAVIAKEVEAQYKVRSIGRVPDVRERLYAVTVERRIKHPAVVAICEAARTLVFPERAVAPSK
jgi:LysR family transcriptional regulator, transcriptional activator of nhaA